MASNTYARFYPFEKGNIPDELVAWMLSDIDADLRGWAKYYFVHPEKEYLEINISSKSLLDFDLFKDEKVLSHFHIWIRISDGVGFPDIIGLKSTRYTAESTHLFSNSILKHYGSDSWNYFNTCLYGADSFSLHMKNHSVETIGRFVNNFWKDIDLNPAPEGFWKMTANMYFFKGSYVFLHEPEHNGEPLQLDVCTRLRGSRSGINSLICGDSRVALNSRFVEITHKRDDNCKIQRIDDNLLEVCLWHNGTQIHRWKWDDEQRHWVEDTSLSWGHCADPEYLRFLLLYERDLIPPSNAPFPG